MRLGQKRARLIAERLEDGARELGILLIAFAPLDYAFADDAGHFAAATLFFTCGVLFFVAGVALEVGRGDAS